MRRLVVTFGLCLGLTAPVFADPAMTTAPTLMRAAPSPKARIVQDIPGNAQIDLSHCSGAWCYASWRDIFGYVRADAVGTAPPGPYGPRYYGPPPVVSPWWGWGRPFYYGYGWGYRW